MDRHEFITHIRKLTPIQAQMLLCVLAMCDPEDLKEMNRQYTFIIRNIHKRIAPSVIERMVDFFNTDNFFCSERYQWCLPQSKSTPSQDFLSLAYTPDSENSEERESDGACSS